jgi:hypothetical protein
MRAFKTFLEIHTNKKLGKTMWYLKLRIIEATHKKENRLLTEKFSVQKNCLTNWEEGQLVIEK